MGKQLSLFDFVEKMSTESCNYIGKIVDDVDDIDYLQRGEKIISLLRNKKRKNFIPSGVFDAVNKKAYMSRGLYKRYDYVLSCAEKILRHMWEKACENDELTSFFIKIGVHDVAVSRLEECDEAASLIKELTRKQTFEGAVKIQYSKNILYAPVGKVKLTRKQSGGQWFFRGSRNRYTIVDVPRYFKRYYLYNTLRDRINLEIEGLTEEQLNDNRIIEFMRSSISDVFNEHSDERGLINFDKEVLEVPYIRNFIKEHGYSVRVVDKNDTCKRIYKSNLMPLWFLSSEPYNFYDVKDNYSFLVKLLDLLLSVYIEDKQSYSFHKNLASDYARSYETKKAIPQKTLNAMKHSTFNDYFGYVEFDAECDLDKIREIEKEFQALHSNVFYTFTKKEDVSLRFRKLGQHKANGLYFPMLKCLCVDVRSPSSMVHEYGHMLDYEAGNVSKGVKFHRVKEIYTDLLEKFIDKLSKDDPLRKKLEGNTKYNKDYYLESTEIFARALEMYIVRELNVDNSLVKPDGGFAYPIDDMLMNAINEFFDGFLYEVPAAKAVASN